MGTEKSNHKSKKCAEVIEGQRADRMDEFWRRLLLFAQQELQNYKDPTLQARAKLEIQNYKHPVNTRN